MLNDDMSLTCRIREVLQCNQKSFFSSDSHAVARVWCAFVRHHFISRNLWRTVEAGTDRSQYITDTYRQKPIGVEADEVASAQVETRK